MNERDIGRLEARVDGLEDDILEIKGDVKSILATVNQSRGGFKVLCIAGGISGAVTSVLIKLIPFTSSMPK